MKLELESPHLKQTKQTICGHLSYHLLDESWAVLDESNTYMKFGRNQGINAFSKLVSTVTVLFVCQLGRQNKNRVKMTT